MRAHEAKDVARLANSSKEKSIKLLVESVVPFYLEIILERIKHTAELGYYNVDFHMDMKKEHRRHRHSIERAVAGELEKMGYKVSEYLVSVSWK